MRDFRTLAVWQKAHEFTLEVYQITQAFPASEIYGLTSQSRRSAASIAANIAEGCGRSGERELARFMMIALGSASETEYHLLLAHDLRLLGDAAYTDLNQRVTEVKRMLTVFTRRLGESPRASLPLADSANPDPLKADS